MQVGDGSKEEIISIATHESEDAEESDREVEKQVQIQEECEDEIICQECDESQEEECMPVQVEEEKLREESDIPESRP